MSTTAPRSALGLTIDTLHEAARLMEERALAATRGPWRYPPTRGWTRVVMTPHGCVWAPNRGRDGQLNHEPDGTHIASWHPTVALAVADWLDRTARILPVGDNGGPAVLPGSTYEAALAVATAYLGESA